MMGTEDIRRETAGLFNKGNELGSGYDIEYPRHHVRITKPFYLGTYHVTRGQFREFVKATGYKTVAEKDRPPGMIYEGHIYTWDKPGYEQTNEHPVVCIGWDDAMAFCKWLSRKEGKAYRLPTEAEWEYACRAGTTTRFYSGDDPETLATVGNVTDAAFKAKYPDCPDAQQHTIKASDGYVYTAPVGQFKPNAFGLYDMHGNAWQWCSDWWGAGYYARSPLNDPKGPETGTAHILRGGSCGYGPFCAAALTETSSRQRYSRTTLGSA